MGKVFVKGPVESPDDLLSKSPKWDIQKQRIMPLPQREAIEWLGENKGRVARGAGKTALGIGGAAIGAMSPADSFQQWIGNMFRAGKIGWNAINSKNAIDTLRDKFMLEHEAREKVRQQMQPHLDTQAYRELKDRYNLSPQDAREIYGNLSPQDMLNQERIVQQGLGREERRNVLRGQQSGEQSQAEQTAEEIAAAGRDPMEHMVSTGKKIRQGKIDAAQQAVDDMEDVRPQPNIEAIANHPETNALPEGGENTENVNDAAMEAKVLEGGLNDNDEEMQEALQQQGGPEGEEKPWPIMEPTGVFAAQGAPPPPDLTDKQKLFIQEQQQDWEEGEV